MSEKRSCDEKERDSKHNKMQRKFDLWKKNDITLTVPTTPSSTKNSKFGFNLWKIDESQAASGPIKISDLKIGFW